MPETPAQHITPLELEVYERDGVTDEAEPGC